MKICTQRQSFSSSLPSPRASQGIVIRGLCDLTPTLHAHDSEPSASLLLCVALKDPQETRATKTIDIRDAVGPYST